MSRIRILIVLLILSIGLNLYQLLRSPYYIDAILDQEGQMAWLSNSIEINFLSHDDPDKDPPGVRLRAFIENAMSRGFSVEAGSSLERASDQCGRGEPGKIELDKKRSWLLSHHQVTVRFDSNCLVTSLLLRIPATFI